MLVERRRRVVHADGIAEGDLSEAAVCPRRDDATVGRDETALVGAELKRQQSAVTAAPDRLFGLLGDRRLVCVDGHVLKSTLTSIPYVTPSRPSPATHSALSSVEKPLSRRCVSRESPSRGVSRSVVRANVTVAGPTAMCTRPIGSATSQCVENTPTATARTTRFRRDAGSWRFVMAEPCHQAADADIGTEENDRRRETTASKSSAGCREREGRQRELAGIQCELQPGGCRRPTIDEHSRHPIEETSG